MKAKNRYAYCTFLIESDRYLPGNLMFAYALRKQNIAADLVCVVTDEVPDECRRLLRLLYDRVFTVRQTTVPNRHKAKRGDREKLFTRFAVLDIVRKQHLDYEKIILCDADLLPLRNYADLCSYPSPSGILNEKKENVIGRAPNGEWIWYDVYREIPPMSGIPPEITDRVRSDHGNLGVNSVIYIFDKSTIRYEDIEADLCGTETADMISAFPWPDMQYMTYKLSGKWHNLDIRYAAFNSFPDLHSVFGTHYAGLKPWDIHNRSYLHYCKHEDYKLWLRVYLNMLTDHPVFMEYGRLRKLYHFFTELAGRDRRYVLRRRDYPELRHLLRAGISSRQSYAISGHTRQTNPQRNSYSALKHSLQKRKE